MYYWRKNKNGLLASTVDFNLLIVRLPLFIENILFSSLIKIFNETREISQLFVFHVF